MANRILFIDYLKAIAMILVIMGHVNFANHDVKAWIYSFHMPVFFFASGLVMKCPLDGEGIFTRDIKRKFSRLMIPYFLWTLLYAKFSIINLGKIIYGSYRSIVSSGTLTSLWFLPVLFLSMLMYYAIEKTKWFYTSWSRIIVTILAFAIGYCLPHIKFGYPWAINVAFVAFGFFLIGNIVKKYISNVFNYFRHHLSIGLPLCLLMVFLSLIGTLAYNRINPDTGYVLMANAHYGDMFLFVFVALCGIMLLLSFSMFIDLICSGKSIRWLSFVGTNTLCIFAVQKPIISCFGYAFKNVPVSDGIVLLVTTIGTLIVSCCICLFINKYAPAMAGKA